MCSNETGLQLTLPDPGGHFEENMYLTQIRTLKAPKKSNTLHRNPKFFAKLTLSTCSSMVECNFHRQQPWLDNVFSPNYKLLTVEFKCNMFPWMENDLNARRVRCPQVKWTVFWDTQCPGLAFQ